MEIISALFLLLPFQQLRPLVQTLRVTPQAGGLRTFLKVCGLCVRFLSLDFASHRKSHE